MANTELQNKQDLPTICRSLLFVQPTLWFCCQTNIKAPKVDRFSCTLIVKITRLLFCLWTDPLWSWWYSLEKFNCRGWCVVLSAFHWVQFTRCLGGRSSPNQASGRIPPCHPVCLAQWNDGKIILMSLRYPIIWRKIIERRRKSRRKQ